MDTSLMYLTVFLTLATCQSDDTTAIDFSDGTVDEDGVVCVEREEEMDKVEQQQEQQCTQQNVTQCYNSYTTQYRDVVRERCEDVYIKTCKIVMRQKTYNHTSRICKKPLVKECFDPLPVYSGYGSTSASFPPDRQPETVCQTVYETACNTTNGVTICEQVERKICADDNCVLVEGDPQCEEFPVENNIDIPEETCDMKPTRECKNVTTSVPQLLPEEICREVPKELCQTVFLNPKTIKVKDVVKYCMNEPNNEVENERLDLGVDEDPRNKFEKLLKQPRLNSKPKKTEFRSNRERLLRG